MRRAAAAQSEAAGDMSDDTSISSDTAGTRKPLKLWDVHRNNKLGMVAGSLKEFVTKGKARLGIPETAPVRLVLEVDGTAVDDEEYFSTLEPHTVLMLIPPGHRWTDSKTFEYTVQIGDEPDACGSGGAAAARRSHLLHRLRADPGYIALLGGTDLELLGALTPDQATGYDAQFVADIQEASCRYLDGRRDVEEALSFLKHCKKGGN
ncbi:DNA fragmentation factor subunit alpha-like [Amphibalanus amphitrite]|uniref:DNA fragmentation factor subunit alpha-like n=1 Tax=Amphibalanus amphitrite TaxID=1232801 RepID=UPI001C916192|nr:DNA fragmentation factor subunit alpha-like [Amphibalanus amphitrite]